MPSITLRRTAGQADPTDLSLSVSEKTHTYLMSSHSREIRVSAFFERDEPRVEAEYAEVFVAPDCGFRSVITKLIPGSKNRTGITLPDAMVTGEQLTILVARERLTT